MSLYMYVTTRLIYYSQNDYFQNYRFTWMSVNNTYFYSLVYHAEGNIIFKKYLHVEEHNYVKDKRFAGYGWYYKKCPLVILRLNLIRSTCNNRKLNNDFVSLCFHSNHQTKIRASKEVGLSSVKCAWVEYIELRKSEML